jgi:predicted GIY-YIG superfamily endonuclease
MSAGLRLTLPCPQQFGYVYLICFGATPYKHAAHYLGSTINLEARLELHRHGNGARLMEVVNQAGISWHVSRIWQCESPEAARLLEAKLKRQHHDGRLCPTCKHRAPDPLAMLYQGHYPFHLFAKPGKRQPTRIDIPCFVRHNKQGEA